MYKSGDRVVYRLTKYSPHPTPRAVEVRPERQGEFYQYDVLKYWVVSHVQPDGHLVVVTRRGKTRTVNRQDPALRRATWFERLFLQGRFPQWPVRPEVEPKKRMGSLSYER